MRVTIQHALRLAAVPLAVGALATMLVQDARSATIVEVSLPASQDATIFENFGREASPAVAPVVTNEALNFNSSTLRARTRNNSSHTETAIRHEASIIEIPLGPILSIVNAGGTIDDVHLSLTAANARFDNHLRVYGVRAADDENWDEDLVTYANAPAMYPDTVNVLDIDNVTVLDVLNDVDDEYSSAPNPHQYLDMVPVTSTDNTGLIATPLGVVRTSGGSNETIGVPILYPSNPTTGFDNSLTGLLPFVQLAAAEGDDSITLIIHANRAGSSSLAYFSSEGATSSEMVPQLIVSATQVPEPSTLLLLGFSAVAVVAVGRRVK